MKPEKSPKPRMQLLYDLAKIPVVLGCIVLFLWVVANPEMVTRILEAGAGALVLGLFLILAVFIEWRKREKSVWAVREGLETAVSICKRNVSGYFLSIVVLFIPKFFFLPLLLSDYAQTIVALVFFLLTRSAFTSSYFWQTYKVHLLTGVFIFTLPLIFDHTVQQIDFYQALAALPAIALVQHCYRRHGFKNKDDDNIKDQEKPLCARHIIGVLLTGVIFIIPYFFGEPLLAPHAIMQTLFTLAAFFWLMHAYTYFVWCQKWPLLVIVFTALMLIPFLFSQWPTLATILRASIVVSVFFGLQYCLHYTYAGIYETLEE